MTADEIITDAEELAALRAKANAGTMTPEERQRLRSHGRASFDAAEKASDRRRLFSLLRYAVVFAIFWGATIGAIRAITVYSYERCDRGTECSWVGGCRCVK